MGDIVKHHDSIFELNATRNDAAIGFFQRASPPNNDNNNNNNNKISSVWGPVPGPKTGRFLNQKIGKARITQFFLNRQKIVLAIRKTKPLTTINVVSFFTGR